MPTLSIPDKRTKKWRGLYLGEFYGNILHAFNIDLERNPGTIHLSDQLQEVLTSDDDSDLALPLSFLLSNADGTDRYWARAGNVLFKSTNNGPESTWAQDAITGTPTNLTNGDGNLLEYKNDMYIPNGTNIAQMSGGTWDDDWWTTVASGAALAASVVHVLDISPVGDFLVTDGRFLNSWDGSTVSDPKITLPSNYEMTDMKTIGDFTIIATKTIDGTEAMMFHYDGTSTTYNNYYPAGTNDVKKIFGDGGNIYIITANGQIRKFTGASYEELRIGDDTVVGFPVDITGTIKIGGVGPLDGKVGIVVGSTSTTEPTELHGIWLFDPVTLNLYPKYALSLAPTESNQLGGHSRYDNPGGYLETARGSGKFLVGGRLKTTGSTQKYAICTSKENSTATHRGWFVTPKIPTSSVRDFWKRVTLLFEKMEASGDRIIVKYRTSDAVGLPIIKEITWVDTTSFTVVSATDLSAGDEVFVTLGPFPSFSTHIKSISGTTITIDDATPASSTDTGNAIFDNWTLLGTISDQTIQNTLMRIAKKSTFIQFKIELRGTETSPEFHELLVESSKKSR